MKSFINLITGVIETPNNSMVIEQYEKSDLYEEYKPATNKNIDKELTLEELKKQADALGLHYNKKITKAKLIKMLADANQE